MIRLYLEETGVLEKPTAVCLGFFDGVHIGHVELVRRAQDVARDAGLDVCVHTFDQMPVKVLQPSVETLELTPLPQKARLLEDLGVDVLAISAFEQTVHMRAEVFFHDILLGRLAARHIVAGFHHRFGWRGEGDVDMLGRLCEQAGIGLDIVAPVTLDSGELISSTAIRRAVQEGDLKRAEQMLGRPYRYEG